MFDIPKTENGNLYTSDPNASAMISLLGGFFSGGVALSNDQKRNLMKVYGLRDEEEQPMKELFQAALNRDIVRCAERDGLRVMAVIARFLEKGQDPVKFVVQLLLEAGCDIGDLGEWACNED